MKILNLNDTYRDYLRQRGSLSLDVNGDEILAGLNHAESIEYVGATNGSVSSPLPTNFPDPQRFLNLSERHENARPKELTPLYLITSRFFY